MIPRSSPATPSAPALPTRLVDGIVLGHQGDACVEPRQPIDEFPSRHCRTQHQALVQHRNEGAAKERGRAGRGLRLREEIGISWIRTVCFRESLGVHGKLSRNHGIVFQPSKFHWGAIFSPYFWRGYLQEKDGRVLPIVNQTNHRNGILSWARNRNPPKIHRFVSFVR